MSSTAEADILYKVRSGSLSAAGVDITLASDLTAIEPVWRDFQTRASCTPFQTYEWMSACQRTIGAAAGAVPVIVLLQRHGQLAAIIPLAFHNQRARQRITFLGNSISDYNAPLLAPSFASLFPRRLFLTAWKELMAILRTRYGYAVLCLDKIPERVGDQRNPMAMLPKTPNASGAHHMALGTDWESFYSAKRSSGTRRNDRAKLRKMEAYGAVDVSSASDTDSAHRILETLVAQKSKWFEERGIPNIFANPGVSSFFRELLKTGPELIHLSELKIGDSSVATNLGLRFNGCYYHILASHDDGPATRFGPGVLHLREIIQFAIREGCSRFDFTIGDEPYKFEWADSRLDLYDHVSGAGILGNLIAYGLTIKGAAKRTIKNTPALWKAASFVRSMI
jgi:CelD/BcsL family acetyltransferase involved in cellulose biosynthesis